MTEPTRRPRRSRDQVLALFTVLFGLAAVVHPIFCLVAFILGIFVLATRRSGGPVAGAGIVLGIFLAGLSFYIPRPGSREPARRSVCLANLKSISMALDAYRADNHRHWPRLANWGDPVQPLGRSMQADELWQSAEKGGRPVEALGTAAMQNVWLLIAGDLIPADAFVCPSDAQFEERNEATKYGWTRRCQLSYGLHYPYDGPDESTPNPAAWTRDINGGVVILADQNPATFGNQRRGKGVRCHPPVVAPTNHEKDGESVLFADGRASFYEKLDENTDRPKDSRCGRDGDDIYVAGRGDADIPQTYTDDNGNEIRGEIDSYIVPTTDK